MLKKIRGRPISWFMFIDYNFLQDLTIPIIRIFKLRKYLLPNNYLVKFLFGTHIIKL